MTRAALPAAFLSTPIAHRALHDSARRRPENSRAAVTAAIEAGYGIEIDVQLSADSVAMVFHDDRLDRLTEARGPLRERTADELARLGLKGGDEGIPRLEEILAVVSGRVPLLIEIKDQSRGVGTGPLERATAAAIRGYGGAVAAMSFAPDAVAAMARATPAVPRGLTTGAFRHRDAPRLSPATRERLREIADFDAVGASFVSHQAGDLERPRVTELKASGVPILCWTIRNAREEAAARRIADNITFEGYLPDHP